MEIVVYAFESRQFLMNVIKEGRRGHHVKFECVAFNLAKSNNLGVFTAIKETMVSVWLEISMVFFCSAQPLKRGTKGGVKK